MSLRTGEAAWVESDPRKPRTRYVWERNYRVLGRYVALTRRGRTAARAHARLCEEAR